jgi:hypothetical protein
MSALFKASPTLSMDPAIPASSSASVNAIDVYCSARVRVMHEPFGGEPIARAAGANSSSRRPQPGEQERSIAREATLREPL